jgi:hypothetical protein
VLRRFVPIVVIVLLGATLSTGTRTSAAVAPMATEQCSGEVSTPCQVGWKGPMGGVVFYDAGSPQWWGQYLEAWPTSFMLPATWGKTSVSIYTTNPLCFSQCVTLPVGVRREEQRWAMRIGMGPINTFVMQFSGSPLATALDASQRSGVIPNVGWIIPSKDELDALYNAWKLGRVQGSWSASPTWTSTESEDTYAWYQLFQDGTQFTDANGIIPKYATNKLVTTSPVHVGSAFASDLMRVIPIRHFGSMSGKMPVPPLLTTPTTGSCARIAIDCKVGDVGPAGGVVVYDAGADQSWGRYLEVAPRSCEQSALPWMSDLKSLRLKTEGYDMRLPRISSVAMVQGKAIGTGLTNTKRALQARNRVSQILRRSYKFQSAMVAASIPCNGFSDWFLPSKDELNEACRVLSHSRVGRQLTPNGGFDRGYYWTSSDYNGRTAWSQYFADCQQFDRVQTLSGNMTGARRPFLVRPMRAFVAGQIVSGPPTDP